MNGIFALGSLRVKDDTLDLRFALGSLYGYIEEEAGVEASGATNKVYMIFES
jgi:hypothetical protein